MPLPSLTALQFKIIEILLGATMKGRELRKRLGEAGIELGGPAFYQAMSRLAQSGFVDIFRSEKEIMETAVVETSYRVNGAGKKAYEETRDFYAPSFKRARSLAYGR